MLGIVTAIIIAIFIIAVGVIIYLAMQNNGAPTPISNTSSSIIRPLPDDNGSGTNVDDEAEYRSHWIFYHCYFDNKTMCD